MRAADLDKHTHQGKTITGVDTHGKHWTFRLHNIIHEDGLVFLCHQKHGARPFHPDTDIEVTP